MTSNVPYCCSALFSIKYEAPELPCRKKREKKRILSWEKESLDPFQTVFIVETSLCQKAHHYEENLYIIGPNQGIDGHTVQLV